MVKMPVPPVGISSNVRQAQRHAQHRHSMHKMTMEDTIADCSVCFSLLRSWLRLALHHQIVSLHCSNLCSNFCTHASPIFTCDKPCGEDGENGGISLPSIAPSPRRGRGRATLPAPKARSPEGTQEISRNQGSELPDATIVPQSDAVADMICGEDELILIPGNAGNAISPTVPRTLCLSAGDEPSPKGTHNDRGKRRRYLIPLLQRAPTAVEQLRRGLQTTLSPMASDNTQRPGPSWPIGWGWSTLSLGDRRLICVPPRIAAGPFFGGESVCCALMSGPLVQWGPPVLMGSGDWPRRTSPMIWRWPYPRHHKASERPAARPCTPALTCGACTPPQELGSPAHVTGHTSKVRQPTK